MADISKFFHPKNGISFDDETGIFYGTADPSTTEEVAPKGSFYLRKTASGISEFWKKFGSDMISNWESSKGATMILSTKDKKKITDYIIKPDWDGSGLYSLIQALKYLKKYESSFCNF